MNIGFETVRERDMDFLIMRQFAEDKTFVKELFLSKIGISDDFEVLEVSHSVKTSDGESDIVVVIEHAGEKIGLLIEDKVNADPQENQADRYLIRGGKEKQKKTYKGFYTFIMAPRTYLYEDEENKKVRRKASGYEFVIPYEAMTGYLHSEFDLAVIKSAVDPKRQRYTPIRDDAVTEFWTKMYDFVEEKYGDCLHLQGEKGESRGNAAHWATINIESNKRIVIKFNRDCVDLEIGGMAGSFLEFCKKNQPQVEGHGFSLWPAGDSLAVRAYIKHIDLQLPFEEQKPQVEEAFEVALRLMELAKNLK